MDDFSHKSTRELQNLKNAIEEELNARKMTSDSLRRKFTELLRTNNLKEARNMLEEHPKMQSCFIRDNTKWAIAWATSAEPLVFLSETAPTHVCGDLLESIWPEFIATYNCVRKDKYIDKVYLVEWLACVDKKLDLLRNTGTFERFLARDDSKYTVAHYPEIVAKIKARYDVD